MCFFCLTSALLYLLSTCLLYSTSALLNLTGISLFSLTGIEFILTSTLILFDLTGTLLCLTRSSLNFNIPIFCSRSLNRRGTCFTFILNLSLTVFVFCRLCFTKTLFQLEDLFVEIGNLLLLRPVCLNVFIYLCMYLYAFSARGSVC
jgi:hypothetical protein